MALTKVVQEVWRTLWLGTEVSVPVPMSSPPTQKVLKPWYMLPVPPASPTLPLQPSPTLHGLSVTAQASGPLSTQVLHVSSWNSSRRPFLAFFSFLFFLDYLFTWERVWGCRGGQKERSRLPAQSIAWHVARSQEPDIMTWAKSQKPNQLSHPDAQHSLLFHGPLCCFTSDPCSPPLALHYWCLEVWAVRLLYFTLSHGWPNHTGMSQHLVTTHLPHHILVSSQYFSYPDLQDAWMIFFFSNSSHLA